MGARLKRGPPVQLQGGVARAELQLYNIIEAGDGIVFAPGEGDRRVIDRVLVTHFTAISVSPALESCRRASTPWQSQCSCGGAPKVGWGPWVVAGSSLCCALQKTPRAGWAAGARVGPPGREVSTGRRQHATPRHARPCPAMPCHAARGCWSPGGDSGCTSLTLPALGCTSCRAESRSRHCSSGCPPQHLLLRLKRRRRPPS